MSNLLMFVFFLSVLAIIVGMLRPDLVLKFINEEKRTKKNVLIIFGLSMIISLVLAAVVS